MYESTGRKNGRTRSSKGARLVERKSLWGEKASLNSGYTLDFLIEYFHAHECSDVCDKFYGLLGPLLSDEDFGGNILKSTTRRPQRSSSTML